MLFVQNLKIMTSSFEEAGYDFDSSLSSFIRALDAGGIPWEGKDSYDTLNEALQDLETGLEEQFREIYGE